MPPNTQQNFNANQAGLTFRTAALPNFLQNPIAVPQDVYQPQAAAYQGADPYAKLATDTYNQQLQDYARSQQLAQQTAERGRAGLADQYNLTANLAEQQRIAGGNNARQNYQDTLLQTRNRARAMGAGDSSGYLDLASRADRSLSDQLMGINTQTDQVLGQAALNAQTQIGKIEQDLRTQIGQIEADRRLSLRQKDAAILDAQTRAAENAMRLNLLNQGNADVPAPAPLPTPDVLGASTRRPGIQVEDSGLQIMPSSANPFNVPLTYTPGPARNAAFSPLGTTPLINPLGFTKLASGGGLNFF